MAPTDISMKYGALWDTFVKGNRCSYCIRHAEWQEQQLTRYTRVWSGPVRSRVVSWTMGLAHGRGLPISPERAPVDHGGSVHVADVELGSLIPFQTPSFHSACSSGRFTLRTTRHNWLIAIDHNRLVVVSNSVESRPMALLGHTRPIIDVQLSLSEQVLVSRSDDGIAFLWTFDGLALNHKTSIVLNRSAVVRLASDYLLASAGTMLEIYTGLSSFPIRTHRLSVKKRPIVDLSWISLQFLAALNCSNEVITYRLLGRRIIPMSKLGHSELILSLHPRFHFQEDERSLNPIVEPRTGLDILIRNPRVW